MTDRSSTSWPGDARGAISIRYDDALPCHYQLVAPAWESHGLCVTFYTQIYGVMASPEAWRGVAEKGHELGNHSIFHPCRKHEGMNWLADDYDLSKYTPRRWSDEMRIASSVLSSLDGKTERSFGNNCCNPELGEGDSLHSLEPLIEEQFVAGRGPHDDQVVDVSAINYSALGHFGADGRTFEDLKQEIERGIETGGWIIYMIHGVGEGTHGMYMDPDQHQLLVNYLSRRQDTIWTAPVATVARYLRDLS